MERVSKWLPYLYLPLVLLLAAEMAWEPITGGIDFWAHAAIGRWIVEHGAVPRESLFIWGQTPIPWVYHSWLSQLTFYLTMALGGEDGGPYLALGLATLIVLVSFVLIWRLWRGRASISFLTPLVFGFALWCSGARFRPRPELFSALFLTILLIYLVRWRDAEKAEQDNDWRRSWRGMLAIAAMFTLWANFHGGVALGLLLLGLTAVADLAQYRADAKSRRLLLLLVLCVAAICINPYGLEYWQALKPVGGRMFSFIDEWKKPWADPALPLAAIISPLALAGLALVVWLRASPRRWAYVAWVLLLCLMFLSARRNLWSLSQVCLVVVAAHAAVLEPRALLRVLRLESLSPVTRLTARLAPVLLLLLVVIQFVPERLQATSKTLPRRATSFIKQNDLQGKYFVDYVHTSYWQWRFGGRPPAYLDLLNAYDDQLMVNYWDIVHREPRALQQFENMGVDYVFAGPHSPKGDLKKFTRYLDGSDRWQRVYQASDGTLWRHQTTGDKTTTE